MTATQRTIATSRFGELTVGDDRILTFVSPILGFEDVTEYVLLDHSDDSPFHWLQAATMPELAFVVTNPQFFGIPYEFVLPDEASEQLNLQRAEDALVLTIVNIPAENPQAMTANLLGPIVVNNANQTAAQVILSDSDFATKTPLLTPPNLSAETKGTAEDNDALPDNVHRLHTDN